MGRRWRTGVKANLVALLALAVLLSACATVGDQPQSYVATQYKALAASQEAYNVSWGAFKRLYDTKAVDKSGNLIISQEQYQKGLQFATTYYDAWMAWINAVMEYERQKGAGGTLTVEQKAALVQKAAVQLLDLIQPYIQKSAK